MRVALILAVLACFPPPPVNGQRLYRKDMDAAAQAAVKAMSKVDSKDLFGAMLQNLSTQSAQDFDTVFSGIRRQTRDRIQSWDNWCSVDSDVVATMVRLGYAGLLNPKVSPSRAAEPVGKDAMGRRVEKSQAVRERDLKASCRQLLESTQDAARERSDSIRDLSDLLGKLEGEKAARQREIDELKATPATTEPRLLALLGQAGNLSEAEQALQQFRTSLPNGKLTSLAEPASLALGILQRLGTAYQDYKERRDKIDKVKDQLRELRAEMMKIAVLKLVAEEEHLNRLLAIEARRAGELEDAAESFEEYRTTMLCERERDDDLDLERIDDSLRDLGLLAANNRSSAAQEFLYSAEESLKQEKDVDHRAFCKENRGLPRFRLQALSRALFQAAAVQTRGATPEYLAELRRAQEEQRYSIVQSSLEARAYETLVNTGVQRLALLHAGGIKPEQVAQLVFQAGQLAGVGLIAAKQ